MDILNAVPELTEVARNQSDATRKRQRRQQTARLFADLSRLSDLHRGAASAGPPTSEQGSAGAPKEDFVHGGRVEVLRKVTSIVKHYTSQSPEQRAEETDASVMWYHRPGMLLSSTLGTMLISTIDLVVKDTSRALANMWMLAEENERSQGLQTTLVGQSLWTLVHWDDHDALSEMQAMFERRDCSVVGRRIDLLLIRMTNSEEGGLAKAVRRRLEVLHLSDDGETALLGLNVRDEDRRALVIGEEGREFLKHCHVFKLKTVNTPGQSSRDGAKEAANDSQGATEEDSVRSLKHIQAFSNWTRTMDAWGSFSPDMFPVICKDSPYDGALRHMVFARVSFAGSLSGQSHFFPLFNVRSGYFTSSSSSPSGPGNASQFAATSSSAAWMGWMIPGDDSHSRKYPWEFKRALGKPEEKQSATHGCRFLISFFVGPRRICQLGECAGYLHASQTGPILLARMTGGITERRPWMRSEPKTVCLGDWDSKLQDSQELVQQFISWGGQSPFYDAKDALP